MHTQQPKSSGEGLERSCAGRRAATTDVRHAAAEPEWIASAGPIDGVEILRARLTGEAYRMHRHDTYAVGVTDSGVQRFDYRGTLHTSLPGQVVVLYPDEPHNGGAGTAAGLGYRIVYIDPARLAEAVRAIRGRRSPLPFVRDAVTTHARLAQAIGKGFQSGLAPLAVSDLIVELAEGLLEAEAGAADGSTGIGTAPRRIDLAAAHRARQFLDAERHRTVRSAELEAVTGLTRYDLARQFRAAFGTSPHRYQLMRRLEHARAALHEGQPLARVACDSGFADQAHFTRAFGSAFGLTPGRYRMLCRTHGFTGGAAGLW